jgi:LPS export ABC transporter protein LptC
MKTLKISRYILLGSIFSVIILLLSCKENDVKQVNRITKSDTSPNQSAKILKVDYTENGKLIYTMTSQEMRKFEQPEPRTEFPFGFDVVFYDSLQQLRGTARANYALSHDATQVIELKGNVIIVNNQAKTRIETEKMFWDRNKKTIYGDMAVRIITPEKVVNAGGFTSNEDLSKYDIIHPTGTFYVKEF